MKKFLFAAVAASGFCLTACNNAIDGMMEQQNESNVIGFNTYSMMSKGTPIVNNEDFAKEGSSFKVMGFVHNGTTVNPSVFLDAQITHQDNKWGYVNPLDKVYWPNNKETVNFFAMAPYSDVRVAENSFVVSEGITANIAYTVPTITADQQDLMYAAKNQGKPATGTSVSLQFRHALNQIHFKAKTDTKNLYVDIETNGITLCNINSKGTFSFSIPEENSNLPSGWSITESLVNYTTVNNSLTVNKTDTPVAVTESMQSLMLLPQKIMAWVPSFVTPQALSTIKESYLKINCKIYTMLGNEKMYYHGSDSKFEYIYVPFAGKNMDETGKKITYTLVFGGGYTEDGKPVLTPITFETEVDSWVEMGSDVNAGEETPSTPPAN